MKLTLALKIILTLIGAVLLIWFLLPVFSRRIINIGNLTGMGVALVLLLYGIFMRPVNKFLASLWKSTAGKIAELFVSAIILAIIVLAVLTMISMAKGMSPSYKISGTLDSEDMDSAQATSLPDTIIILGARVYGTTPENAYASLVLRERLDAAINYFSDHPDSPIIVTGGQGKNEAVTEASIMKTYLIDRGIPEDKIYVEDKSTDTHENFLFSSEIIEENALSKTIVVATNEFHEYRALNIAASLGFDASPIPAATSWWLFPTYYVREMYGILEMWFLK